jgi:Na+/glutamate symporter
VAGVPPAPTTDNPTRKRDVVVSNPTSTVTAGNGGVTINNGGGGATSGKGTSTDREGLTTANKITIGLAIPGAVAGIVTLILAWWKWKKRRQKETQANSAIEGVSVGTEPKPQIVGYGQSEGVQGSRSAWRY